MPFPLAAVHGRVLGGVTLCNISGTVYHANGSTALEGATVALGAYSATSAADGTYTITGVPAGTSGSMTCTLTNHVFTAITVSAMTGPLTAQNYTSKTVLYDTFTAANGTDVNGRAPDAVSPAATTWSVATGSVDIQGNMANPATFSSSRVIALVNSGKADLNYQITWRSGQTAGTADFISAIFRYQDATNFWFVRLGRSGGTTNLWQICELVNNSTNVRASGDYTYAANTTYVISVTANGAAISATRDGGTQISYGSAGTFLTKTTVGFMLYMDGFTNKSRADSVQVYSL